jgi:hypothetical protein
LAVLALEAVFRTFLVLEDVLEAVLRADLGKTPGFPLLPPKNANRVFCDIISAENSLIFKPFNWSRAAVLPVEKALKEASTIVDVVRCVEIGKA